MARPAASFYFLPRKKKAWTLSLLGRRLVWRLWSVSLLGLSVVSGHNLSRPDLTRFCTLKKPTESNPK